MKKPKPVFQKQEVQEKMDEIKTAGTSNLLDFFREKETWKHLTTKDKEELAFIFFKSGEEKLHKQYPKFMDDLKISLTLGAKNIELLIRISDLIVNQNKTQQILEDALWLYNKLTNLNLDLVVVWKRKTQILIQLGMITNQVKYFVEADEIYGSLKVFLTENHLSLDANDLHQWGLALYHLSQHSQEATELRLSVEKYQDAFIKQLDTPAFLIDYANALKNLGFLINRNEMLFDAIELYEKALHLVDDEPAWFSLGCIYRHLFVCFNQENYFEKGEGCFTQAARLNSKDGLLWLNWGRLLAYAGSLDASNPELLTASLEKYEKANALKPKQPVILCAWADSLMTLGKIEERFDYLKGAEEKIIAALQIETEHAEIWCVYGQCLFSMGRYFEDVKYFEQAITKYEKALSLDRLLVFAWHGMGMAYFNYGDLQADKEAVKKSIQCISQAIELEPNSPSYFWNSWGVALMKLAEITDDYSSIAAAIEKFEMALQIESKTGIHSISADCLYNLGCAYDYLGDYHINPIYYEKAVLILSKLLSQYPNLIHVRYSLALALYHLGDIARDLECLEKSIEEFEILIGLENEEELYYTDFGVVVLTKAELIADPSQPGATQDLYEFAEHLFMQAIALGGRSTFYYLACLYSLTNNYPEAIHFLEKAKTWDALPSIDEVMRDSWLEGVRQTSSFRAFLSRDSSWFTKEVLE